MKVDGRDDRDDLSEAWIRIRNLVHNTDVRVRVSEATGLSFVKVKALRHLQDRPHAMHELAAELVTDKPYVTQIINSLEELGHVARSVSVTDRRSRLVTLSESGRELAERADAILNEPPAVFAALGADDLATLNEILGKIPAL